MEGESKKTVNKKRKYNELKNQTQFPRLRLKKKAKQFGSFNDLFNAKIYRPNKIERNIKDIDDYEKFFLDDLSFFTFGINVDQSKWMLNLVFGNKKNKEIKILPSFEQKIDEYFNEKKLQEKQLPKIKPKTFKKRNTINANVIRDVVEGSKNIALSLSKIKCEYAKRMGSADFSISTLHRFVKTSLNYVYKKPEIRNSILNENRYRIIMSIFLRKVYELVKEKAFFVFVDEASFNNVANIGKFWVNSKTPRIIYNKGRAKSVCLILAVTEKGIIHWQRTYNSVNGNYFLSFFKELVKKVNEAHGEENQLMKRQTVYYLDNASVHCSKALFEFYKESKVEVIYGVPYTPDLNVVEFCFSDIKKAFYQRVLLTK